MKIIDCVQGSDEWFAARLGKVTASKFSDVLAKGQGKTRLTYMINLATEIIEGAPAESYCDKNMEAGTIKEPLARAFYELLNDCHVAEVGFVERDASVGASPDGLVGDDGLLEIKCPLGTTHTRYIVEDKVPTAYVAQIQGQLWVTDRQWCDFLSYRPENTKHPHFIKRVDRDEKYIKNLAIEVEIFVADLKKMVDMITKSEF